MRFIGAGLIWISFFMMGLKVSEMLKKRYIIFEELLLMAQEISNGICYLNLPLVEILVGIERNGICKNLEFLTSFSKLTDSGKDFPDAWKHSLSSSKWPLKREETGKILSFGLSLGKSDSENHKGILKLYTAQIKQYADEAHEIRKKHSFTSVTVGLLCGGAVFILLI